MTGAKDAFITTADLKVYALATGSKANVSATTGGGFIVFGGGSGNGNNNLKRYIDWESTTILLGEPNPEIEIDELVTETGHLGFEQIQQRRFVRHSFQTKSGP